MPVGPPLVAPAGAGSTGTANVEGRSTMGVESNEAQIVAASSETRTADRSRERLDRLATYRAEPLRRTRRPRRSDLVEAEATESTALVEQRAAGRAAGPRRISGSREMTGSSGPFVGLFHLMGSVGESVRPRWGGGSAATPTEVTSSGTATSSCCRFLRRRIRQPRGRCSNTACAAFPLRAKPPPRLAGGVRGSRGSPPTPDPDVTPRSSIERPARDEIYTGELEERIVADVAWAAEVYAGVHRRDEFGETRAATVRGNGAILGVAHRAGRAPDAAHLRTVIGPDEYRELVDDNAFTNVMARWNLRRAARALRRRRASRNRAGSQKLEQLAEAARSTASTRARGCTNNSRGSTGLEPLVISDDGAASPHRGRHVARPRARREVPKS